jgi:ATP-dependent helicase/nuclease subunit B
MDKNVSTETGVHPRLRFLGWDRPLLDLACEFLLRDRGGGTLELDDVMVVAPTRQAARRLRLALAEAAATRRTGLFPPVVTVPEGLLDAGATLTRPVEELAVWSSLLARQPPDRFTRVLPRPAQDSQWTLGAGMQLRDLRSLLSEVGLGLREARERLAAALDDSIDWEPDRWDELCELEEVYLAAVHDLGLEDRSRALATGAERFAPSARVERIVVMGVPDPAPLILRYLESAERTVPVTVCVHAPRDLAGAFDSWGRPVPEYWAQREIPIPDRCLHLAARYQDQADRALDLASAAPAGRIAVGVVDESVVPHLQRVFAGAGVATHNPAGTRFALHPLFTLVRDSLQLALEGEYEALRSLVRHPDLLAYLRGACVGFSATDFLRSLDELQNRHLPWGFREVLYWAESEAPDTVLVRGCTALRDLLDPLREAPGPVAILAFLEHVYGSRMLAPDQEDDRAFQDAAASLSEALHTLAERPLRRLCDSNADYVHLLLSQLAQLQLYGEPGPQDLDLQGWLELAWEPCPDLVVTGFNEGRVPSSVVGHPFLPDRARSVLGLSDNRRRLGRDAYLLAGLTACRPEGTLQIVLGRITDDGDVMRPSRLLFHCGDPELPGRARALFRAVDEPVAGGARDLAWAWRLNPPRLPGPERVSVTSLRDYLACPFRFYLRHVLGMGERHDRKYEMDAADFGTLCHAAWEAFARDPGGIRDSLEPDTIAAFLCRVVDREIERLYGTGLSAPVLMQAEALKQRLVHGAAVQAAERAQGWRIDPEFVEYSLGRGDGLVRHGVRVRGKVDRVDRHPSGRVRIIDYKTADRATSPDTTHLAPPGTASDPHLLCEVDGKKRRWTDLQLPVYALLLADELGTVPECAYFALPKAVTETAILPWPGLDTALLASADACAEETLKRIRAGVFGPPAERLTYDAFESLFFDSPDDTLTAEWRAPGPEPIDPDSGGNGARTGEGM